MPKKITVAVTEKKPAKKSVRKVKKQDKVINIQAPIVALRSFTVKATIPTGQYANIQPEIIVDAIDFDAAVAFVMPKIEKMFEDYWYFNDRPKKVASAPVVSSPQSAQVNAQLPPVPTGAVVVTKAEKVAAINGEKKDAPAYNPVEGENSEAWNNAFKAINSCKTHAGLEMIKTNIANSKKLTDQEKMLLGAIANNHIVPDIAPEYEEDTN